MAIDNQFLGSDLISHPSFNPPDEGSKKRRQVAALPVKRTLEGELCVLLVTSRETRRWIIPKGNPIKGLADHEAAATEAREEAGVVGRIQAEAIGSYQYRKTASDDSDPVRVVVYLVAVEGALEKFKEKGQREIRWFSVSDAADLVQELELRSIIKTLTP